MYHLLVVSLHDMTFYIFIWTCSSIRKLQSKMFCC